MKQQITCKKCGSPCIVQVQVLLSLPGDLAYRFNKTALRRKDVEIWACSWETMDCICTNDNCRYVLNGYGNYVTRLRKEYERLHNTYEPDAVSIL